MQHFIRKSLLLSAVALSTLTTFAGNGTLNSPFTVQEAFEQRDALAKSQQEVVLKADFLGFGNSRQTMTAKYKEGDYSLLALPNIKSSFVAPTTSKHFNGLMPPATG